MESAAPARGNRVLIWCAVGLAVFALSKFVHTEAAAGGPPQPAAPGDGPPKTFPTTGAELGFALPTHVDIPKVGLHADLLQVGLTEAGAIDVPPLNQALEAGWYDKGAAPGQVGAAVLDGHVDSDEIPAPHQGAFYQLGQVAVGDTVEVTRADRMVAVYQVDQVQSVSKQQFPTDRVYSPVSFAALRLITCGGDFDYKTHSYLNNVIVYAHLTGSHAE
ncbi:MAG TPA: class F sortase [Actinocrinis sp.]|nr:class F sortase [Actinocrinis sp.]